MDKTANNTAEVRSRLFTQTGDSIGIAANLAEKDFWACWTLKQLFSVPGLCENLIFKGGTTLSKVYGIINRFSEDYDLAMLTASDFCKTALDDLSLLERVVEHKIMYFRCGWASYPTAKPGTFKVIPSDTIMSELKKDYSLMEPMIFGDIPSFESIIDELTALEQKINSL